jgi:DNA-binding transcriptional LysR family regulator
VIPGAVHLPGAWLRTRKDVDHFLKQLGWEPAELRIIAEIDDTESIIEMVSKGLGISIVSQRSAGWF